MKKHKSKNDTANANGINDDMFTIVRRVFGENFVIYRGKYALAILCMVLVAATTSYSAYIIKDVVNDVFDAKDLSAAYFIAGIILVIFFIKGFAAFGQEVILRRIGNNIIARYQRRAYRHFLNLDMGFFNDTRSAYLVGQVNQNIGGINSMLTQILTVFARDLLTVIGLVFVMVWQDPLLFVGSLVVVPIAGYVVSRYVRQIKSLARIEVGLTAKVLSTMVETVQGISIVKAFTMEKQFDDRLSTLVSQAEKQANQIALINARTRPLTETLGGLAIAGSVAFGGWRVIELGGNPGALLSFLAAAMLAYDPARRIAAFRVQFEKSLVNARMLYELLDQPFASEGDAELPDIKISKGKISIAALDFNYETARRAGDKNSTTLDKISLVVEPGKTTALVGPSGGGKTTLLNLILRFYPPDSGTISIDGQDIAAHNRKSLRKNIAYVSQQPVLFEGSVADNIRYARPEAELSEVIAAAKLAQADEFIKKMPQGYDTAIGEMGSNLSGGQRQRLSIARAILRDAPILLLDEATSALDNKSEKLVQKALDKLMIGRTTLVVAHRLSTVQNADRIVVIDQGRITEQGNHKALIGKKSGSYARLHKSGLDGHEADKGKPDKPVKKQSGKTKK